MIVIEWKQRRNCEVSVWLSPQSWWLSTDRQWISINQTSNWTHGAATAECFSSQPGESTKSWATVLERSQGNNLHTLELQSNFNPHSSFHLVSRDELIVMFELSAWAMFGLTVERDKNCTYIAAVRKKKGEGKKNPMLKCKSYAFLILPETFLKVTRFSHFWRSR